MHSVARENRWQPRQVATNRFAWITGAMKSRLRQSDHSLTRSASSHWPPYSWSAQVWRFDSLLGHLPTSQQISSFVHGVIRLNFGLCYAYTVPKSEQHYFKMERALDNSDPCARIFGRQIIA